MKIQALIFDGFEELDLIGMFEPLRLARFDVKLCSLRKQDFVEAAYGLRVIADGVIDINDRPDILLVPGGGWISRAQQGAYAEFKRGEVLSYLSAIHEAGTILASVCTGSLLLAHSGLLKGRPATTNDGAKQELRECGANVLNWRVVDDGEIITAGGITASIDLGLWLIERFQSKDKAAEVTKQLHYTNNHSVWKSSVQASS